MSHRRALLDPFVGFLVWMIHLVVIYSTTAIACQLHRTRGLMPMLIGSTLVAAAITITHGLIRVRQQRALPDRAFRVDITVGSDALATIAIIWQLFAFMIVPFCR